DGNEEAIDVSRFSIYVLLLDYVDPKNLSEFKMPKLGKSFYTHDTFLPRVDNYFIKNQKFDYVIGNPPWGNKKGPHIEYARKKEVPNHRNEISRTFIARAEDFTHPDSWVCLVVTSKILYNKGKQAEEFRQKFLLDKLELVEVLELSTVRKDIFKRAVGPAAVLTYRCRQVSDNHVIKHTSLK